MLKYYNYGVAINSNSDINYTIYPNPFDNQIYIESSDPLNADRISILDLSGREILTFQPENNVRVILNTSRLDKGLYRIRVIKEGEIIAAKKILKE